MNEKTQELLKRLVAENGSDLHLAANNPPMIRIHGKLVPMEGQFVLSGDDTWAIISQIVQADEIQELEKTGELDAAIELDGGYRIRINAYRQQDTYAAALRLLPNRFFEFKELGLPINVLEHICQLHAGLVLVTGATSSGKSTTIASIVNRINQERYCHIHTIEDPVEYRHRSLRSFVTQREIGRDTVTFVEALRRSMREDPDVIVIGEMRDLETMSAALTLAETGHLTFATLHTSTAIQTVSRIVSAFPAAQQPQIRVQLASTLQYAICQKLIPWDNGKGRSLVAEILYVNSAVRAMIREEKSHQINNVMQTNYDKGMRTLDQSLDDAIKQGHISTKTAQLYRE
ncbi:MAG: PilT/PilU family type 4a pilus ATPase [Planctomycetaceae bacterium]|jgi:twitching motility protein PilT|nr:PilT/PilU family type 4a pilus ATPase [Planctomycetaceae bacterium]